MRLDRLKIFQVQFQSFNDQPVLLFCLVLSCLVSVAYKLFSVCATS